MAVTRTTDAIIPAPPDGWLYWYTYHWATNHVHTLRAEEHHKLYLTQEGQLLAELAPGETLSVRQDNLPAKLYVYRKKLSSKFLIIT